MGFDVIMLNGYMENNKIMSHGYRQLYSLHKNRRHLRRYCKRFCIKI